MGVIARVLALLKSFINLDWWHQLPLGEQRVNLLNELKSRVLLIKDKCIDIVYQNWNLTLLKEELQLLPVVFLLRIVLGIIERMHLNLTWEVAGEDLSDQETVIKSASDVFDRV